MAVIAFFLFMRPEQDYLMHSNDPLHGLTLQAILSALVERLGWEGLAQQVDVRCFQHEPSIKSSLTFLRKTPWARAKVEALYLQTFRSPR